MFYSSVLLPVESRCFVQTKHNSTVLEELYVCLSMVLLQVLMNSDGLTEDYHGLIEELLAVGGIDFPLKYQTLNVQELILQNSQVGDG